MATWLKQSTAVTIKVGPFLDQTDGRTAETGLTITQPDVQLSKNGGTFAQKSASGTASHDTDGWYGISLSTTDTNTLGSLVMQIDESGALPVFREYMVVTANTYDSLFGADALDVSVIEWLGTAVAAATAGTPDVNAARLGNTVQTGRDVGASVLISSGTGAGQLDVTAGVIQAQIASVVAGAITSAAFAAGALDAVWSTATRLLTAGTNIILAKGVGVTGFNDVSAAEVNAEVVDALATDTYAEPGQGTPAATASVVAKINYIYKAWRNRSTQDASGNYKLYNDDTTTVDQKATVSDNGTTFDRGEIATGP